MQISTGRSEYIFSVMWKYLIFVAVLAISESPKVYAEQRFIEEIKEGPYQNYSVQPLVDLGGKLYYFEISVESTWDEATLFCRNLGLFLVSIEDATENELIKNHILTNLGVRNYWTSGSDSAHPGSWVWTSTGRPFVFTDWGPGQPDNLNNVEDVMGLRHYGDMIAWDDYGVNPASLLYACCEQ